MKKFLTTFLVVVLLISTAIVDFTVPNKTQSNNDNYTFLSVSPNSQEAKPTLASLKLNEQSFASVTLSSASKEEKPYLKITKPKSKSYSTKSSKVTFKGSTNITSGVTVNGKKIKLSQNSNGSFTISQKLKYGTNKFVLKAGSLTKTYKINRKYTIIKSFSPETEQKYSSGSKFTVSVTAKKNSKVTATFNQKKITLKHKKNLDDGLAVFSGSFTLPEGNSKNLNLGRVKFKAAYKKYTDTAYSKDIICKKKKSVTPKGGNYIDVGSGLITEVVAFHAETFSGKGKNDKSKPYYTYLPKGTVDYGSDDYVTVTSDGQKLKLVTLRCGKKVYKYRYDKPPKKKVTVTKQYAGTLPDHNELSVADFYETETHSHLILDTLWKAPFELKFKNQKYNSDYTISKVTYKYVDITFFYATKFDGKISIPKDHPLFKKAKIIKNKSDYTIRFYLKKKGGFYGWDAYYNSKNQLCFEFLKPVKIKKAKNKYGADLTGARILIDVGHGGIDSGATNLGGRKNSEAVRNLVLAKKLAKELKSIGATVYLTRSDNSTQSADQKSRMLKKLKPDYCIAIHHDSSISSSANGFGAFYYYPFSRNAAKYVLNHTADTGIYKRNNFKWHYYFMSRVSVCPVVLTENGYMSNRHDYNNIKSSKANNKKATAMVKGIVEYFKSIQ